MRWLRGLLVLALFVPIMALPEAEAGVTEFPLPDGFRRPLNLAFDAEGDLWFTLDGTWGIARYHPDEGVFDLANISAPKATAYDSLFGLAIAPDGAVWAGSQRQLHRVSPDDLNVTSFDLPTPSQLTGGIWIGPEGHVWYALVALDRVARLDPATGDIEEHPLEERQVGPTMFEEREGRVWMTLTYAGSVATFDLESGVVVPGTPGSFAAPVGLAADPEGLWVAEHGANTLGRVDLPEGTIRHFPASESPHHDFAGPNDVLVAEDGAVWFAEHLGERIARLDPNKGILYEYDLPSAPQANVLFLTEAPDGSIWYAAWGKDRLGRVTFTETAPPPDTPSVFRVASGEVLQETVDPRFTLLGLPRMDMKGTIEEGRLEIRPGDAPAGEHLVLLSEREGELIRGRYVTLVVEEREASPIGVPWAAMLSLVVLVAVARWRAWN